MGKGKATHLWLPQVEAAKLTETPSRTLRDWIAKEAIAVNADREVDVVEIFLLKQEKQRQEIEKLGSKPNGNDAQRLLEAQARKTLAEAKLREFELARLEGEFIALSEAIADFESALTAVKQKLLALPTRLSLQLSGMTEPKGISKVLDDVIYEALQALSVEFARAGE
jgi:hypothetical protein